MSEKDETIAIVSYVKVNISGQMGGTDSAILMRMGKRKTYIAGGWTRTILHPRVKRENFRCEKKRSR